MKVVVEGWLKEEEEEGLKKSSLNMLRDSFISIREETTRKITAGIRIKRQQQIMAESAIDPQTINLALPVLPVTCIGMGCVVGNGCDAEVVGYATLALE